jgi:Arm DNA-binding domain
LTDEVVRLLTLREDENDRIWPDADLKGFGYRKRRSGGRVIESWVVRYPRPTGARRMTLPAVLNEKQARAAAKKILARVTLGEDPADDKAKQAAADKLTVRGQVEEYLADKRGDVRAATMRDSVRYLTGPYFKPLHKVAIEKVNRRDVAACLTKIKREHGAIVGAAARGKLSALFSWCMRQGFAETNPVIGTQQPNKRAASRERVLNDAELRDIWNAAVEIGGDYGAIVRLMILLGARRQEVAGMGMERASRPRRAAAVVDVAGGEKQERPRAYAAVVADGARHDTGEAAPRVARRVVRLTLG